MPDTQAKPVSDQFVNELGSAIRINIEPTNEGGFTEMLSMSMAGPDSVMENTITRMEAGRLHTALGEFLNM